MKSRSESKASLIVAAAALLLAGYWLGAARGPAVVAQDADAKPQSLTVLPLGVSIPNGGAAVVKGKDGYAYIVDSRGLYVRAAQSGKPLELP